MDFPVKYLIALQVNYVYIIFSNFLRTFVSLCFLSDVYRNTDVTYKYWASEKKGSNFFVMITLKHTNTFLYINYLFH